MPKNRRKRDKNGLKKDNWLQVGDKWATGGLHESYGQFIDLGEELSKRFFGVDIVCHVGSAAGFKSGAGFVGDRMPHDNFPAYLIHVCLISERGKSIAAVVDRDDAVSADLCCWLVIHI